MSPVIAAVFLYLGTSASSPTTSYIFYKPNTNHTKIVEATTINGFEKVLFGTGRNLLNQV